MKSPCSKRRAEVRTRGPLAVALVGILVAMGAGGSPPPPTASTLAAAAKGITGMTVNGRIHPHGVPTSYVFEYGPTPRYGSETAAQELPPRLSAFYRESWDAGLAGWGGGMKGGDLAHHAEGGVAGGFVRFSEPSDLDPNHIDGIGWLHLSKWFYLGWHPNPEGRSAFLAAGDPDLRDARVSLHVRGNRWQPNGSELVWWSQSQRNPEGDPDPRRPNWAYTGFSLNDALQSGEWTKVEYRLLNDADLWTYAGNNLSQKRALYEYWPVNDSQRHLNLDFFHLLAFIDPSNPPKGTIDFDELEIAYRNYSLLQPGNGGKRLAAPSDVPDDAAKLTDGWRNGEGKTWRSAANPKGPLEFVYAFERPVTINSVQIHQHPEWPSKDVEVSTSEGGKPWTPLFQKVMPEDSPSGPNFAFLLERGLTARADRVMVRILSGYKPKHSGLGEIEVFGTGATMVPDDDLYHVNLDLDGLEPGQTYHYRLVARNSSGTARGEDRSFTIPADTRPHVVIGDASRITATTAKVQGRLNPLGKRTMFHFEFGRDRAYGQKSEPQYGGLQLTPRSAFVTLSDLRPGTTYHYRLVGVNETGTAFSADASFTTKSEPSRGE